MSKQFFCAAALALAFLSTFPAGAASAVSSGYVSPGKYTLRTTGGKYLAVDGNNVYISSWGGSGKHEVYLTRNTQGYYSLRSAATGRAVDISGGSTASGANLQTWSWNGTCAQRFVLNLAEGDYYTLRSSCNLNNAIDVAGGAVGRDGANVWSYAYNGSNAQRWRLERVDVGPENGTYRLFTRRGRALDVAGGWKFAGANAQIWLDNGTAAQDWQFTRRADGSYRITNPQAGKSLDVSGGSSESGKNVWIWYNNDTCAQRWFAERKDSEYFILKNACGGMALDVAGGDISALAKNVQVYTPNNTAAQDWLLYKK